VNSKQQQGNHNRRAISAVEPAHVAVTGPDEDQPGGNTETGAQPQRNSFAPYCPTDLAEQQYR
jgi:hypothetical protein